MGRSKKYHQQSLARTREAKLLKNMLQCPSKPSVPLDLDLEVETMAARTHEPILVDNNDNLEDECDWDGSVNYYPSSDSEFEESDSDDGYGSEASVRGSISPIDAFQKGWRGILISR